MAAFMHNMRADLARRKNKLAMTVVASICNAMFEHMDISNYRIEKNHFGKLQLRQSTSLIVTPEKQQEEKIKLKPFFLNLVPLTF